MELVINIDRALYEHIVNNPQNILISQRVTEAIRNGTVLPENHGALIDLDKLKETCGYNFVNQINADEVDPEGDAKVLVKATK